jgi:hypothetical protein
MMRRLLSSILFGLGDLVAGIPAPSVVRGPLPDPRDVLFMPLMRQGRVSGMRAVQRQARKRRNQRKARRAG